VVSISEPFQGSAHIPSKPLMPYDLSPESDDRRRMRSTPANPNVTKSIVPGSGTIVILATGLYSVVMPLVVPTMS
jgi:hypothetical protein